MWLCLAAITDSIRCVNLMYLVLHSDIIGQGTTHNSAMADNEKSERKTEKEQQQHQDVELVTWYRKIEMIGIDIKSLDRENETRRLMLRTTFMNQHFINELDKTGLQLIKIFAGSIFTRGLLVLLEPKSTKMLTE